MKKFLVYAIIISVSLLFVSCPEPLTEDVVTAAQDEIAPTIEIFSPGENDLYYADVEFALNVKDDAKSEGDNKGDIASISFDVSNDDLRGGKINISPEGVITQDKSFGPDAINYDTETGDLTFSFSTVEPSILDGLLSVSIMATDRNGNETIEKVALYENDGPWVDISVVDDNGSRNVYNVNKYVTLSGHIGNSVDNQNTASDIYRIEWSIANKISAKIIQDEDAEYTNSYSGEIVSYYNNSTGLYEYQIDGYLQELYAKDFTFNPATGEIFASIYMTQTFKLIGTVNLVLEVEDRSGHITTQTLFISLDVNIPQLDVTKTLGDFSVAHFSNNGNADLVYGKCSEPLSSLGSYEYQLLSGDVVTQPTSVGFQATDQFYLDDPNGQYFLIDFSSQISTLVDHDNYTSGDEVSILITVKENSESEVPGYSYTLVEDSTAPTISNYKLESNQTRTSYAKDDSNLTMEFRIDETEAMINPDELILNLSLGNYNLPDNSNTGIGDHSFKPEGTAWSSGEISDQNVDVFVSIADRLGNTNVYKSSSHTLSSGESDLDSTPENLGFNVMYYSGAPALDTRTVSTETGTNGIYAASGENITVTVASTRKLETPVITLTSPAGTGAAVVTPVNSTDNNTFNGVFEFTESEESLTASTLSITGIVDYAGNELLSAITTTSDSSSVIYDGIKPTTVGTLSITGSAYKQFEGINYVNKLGTDSSTQLNVPLFTDANTLNYSVSFPGGSTINSPTNSAVPLSAFGYIRDGSMDGVKIPTLTVKDAAGNTADALSYTFTLDTTLPVIAINSFSNPDNTVGQPQFAKDGDELELRFTVSETNGIDPTNSHVYFFGHLEDNPPSAYNTGTPLISNYTTLSSDPSDEYIDFEISISDKAGNIALKEDDEGVTTAKNVMYYYGDLVGDDNDDTVENNEVKVSISTGLSQNSTWVQLNESVTLTVETSRMIEKPEIIIDTKPTTEDPVITGKKYTGSIVINDNTREDTGNLTISVPLVKDYAGNTIANIAGSTDGSFAKYDGKKPTTAGTLSITGTAYKQYGSINYVNKLGTDSATQLNLPSFSDTNALNYSVSFPGGYTVNSTTNSAILFSSFGYARDESDDGEKTPILSVTDAAGNSADDLSYTFILDTKLPEIVINSFSNPDNTVGQPQFAKEGDELALSFTVTETNGIDPTNSHVNFFGHPENSPPPAYNTGVSLTSNYTTLASDPSDDYIDFGITISDNAGNIALKEDDEGVTSTKNVMYYYDVPVLSTVASVTGTNKIWVEMVSNNPINSAFANALDSTEVTVSITSGRQLVNPLIKFSPSDSSAATVETADTAFSKSIIANKVQSVTNGNFIPFTVKALKDKAGNTMADINQTDGSIVNKVTYDNVLPSLTNFSLALTTGLAVVVNSSNWINGNVTGSTSVVELIATDGTDPVALTTLDDHYKGYQITINDFTNTSDYITTDKIITYSGLVSLGLIEDDQKTIKVRVIDEAGNISVEDSSVTVTLDTVKPTAISSISGIGTKTLTINFAAEHGYTGSDFTLSNPPLDSVTSTTSAAILTYTSALSTYAAQLYTIPNTILTDAAGNKNSTVYNLTSSGAAAVSGISNPRITNGPNRIPPKPGSSYRSTRASGYTAPGSSSSGSQNLPYISSVQSESNIFERNAPYVSMSTIPAVAPLAFPEMSRLMRVMENLDTSNKELTRAMEQVDVNSTEYREKLESLLAPELTRAEFGEMNDLLIPEIVAPEVLTVSTSPFMAGASNQVDIILSDDAEAPVESLGYLGLQILGWILAGLLTAGFILLMKKMGKT